jgi:hypothetical protein
MDKRGSLEVGKAVAKALTQPQCRAWIERENPHGKKVVGIIRQIVNRNSTIEFNHRNPTTSAIVLLKRRGLFAHESPLAQHGAARPCGCHGIVKYAGNNDYNTSNPQIVSRSLLRIRRTVHPAQFSLGPAFGQDRSAVARTAAQVIP